MVNMVTACKVPKYQKNQYKYTYVRQKNYTLNSNKNSKKKITIVSRDTQAITIKAWKNKQTVTKQETIQENVSLSSS